MTTTTIGTGYRDLNALVKHQAILERARISAGNQALHVADERVAAFYGRVSHALEESERDAEHLMADLVRTHPAWPWLESVRGIGAQTASLMLAYLLPPRSDKGPSSWYKAAGLYSIQVEGGESRLPRADHLAPGEKINWHPRLRRNLFVVGECLIRSGGFYYRLYKDLKDALAVTHPDWKGRCHAVARIKMVKIFLAHLWEAWSKAEGIPCRDPYPMAILGHTKIAVPWQGG